MESESNPRTFAQLGPTLEDKSTYAILCDLWRPQRGLGLAHFSADNTEDLGVDHHKEQCYPLNESLPISCSSLVFLNDLVIKILTLKGISSQSSHRLYFYGRLIIFCSNAK